MILDAVDTQRVYNKAHLENWTREVAFMEDIQSQNWIEFCYRWFNLASYAELYHEVEWVMNNIICPVNGLREYNRDGLINMMIDTPNHPKYKGKALQEVFILNDDTDKKETYFVPDTSKWDAWRNERQANSFVA